MIGPFVSALIGAVLGFGVRVGHTMYKDRNARNRLRRGLYEEMKTMSDDIDEAAHDINSVTYDADDIPVPADTFITTTYESTADQVGLLTDTEVDDIVEFYSMCFRTQQILDEVDSQDDISPGQALQLDRAMVELQNQLLDAMTTLEEKLDLDAKHSVDIERIHSEPGDYDDIRDIETDSNSPSGSDDGPDTADEIVSDDTQTAESGR